MTKNGMLSASDTAHRAAGARAFVTTGMWWRWQHADRDGAPAWRWQDML